MAQDHQAGKLGKAQVGGVDLHISQWQCNSETREFDSTNTGTDGYETAGHGTSKMSGTMRAVWDANTAAGLPPLIDRETILTNVRLYIGDPANSVFHLLPIVLVLSVNSTSEVHGAVSWEVSWRSSGPFTPAQ